MAAPDVNNMAVRTLTFITHDLGEPSQSEPAPQLFHHRYANTRNWLVLSALNFE